MLYLFFLFRPGVASGTELDPSYPASDPLVTAVGGTVLTGGTELAWNDCNGTGSISCAEDLVQKGGTSSDGASGGGVSQLFSTGPTGQPVLSGTGGYRELPDVSAESGSNYGSDVELYVNGGWGPWLGTSLATPLWAALAADRDTTCVSSTGDFDTELYALYNGGYSGVFNEVPNGYDYTSSEFVAESSSNDYTQTNSGEYPTVTGYDMVTGLGSPLATGLACSEVLGSYSGGAGTGSDTRRAGARERLLLVRRRRPLRSTQRRRPGQPSWCQRVPVRWRSPRKVVSGRAR